MKRRRPDNRLDWRDHNMPVLRDYLYSDGSTRHVIDPDYERRFREVCMEANTQPSYRNDPTYDLKKQRKRL